MCGTATRRQEDAITNMLQQHVCYIGQEQENNRAKAKTLHGPSRHAQEHRRGAAAEGDVKNYKTSTSPPHAMSQQPTLRINDDDDDVNDAYSDDENAITNMLYQHCNTSKQHN